MALERQVAFNGGDSLGFGAVFGQNPGTKGSNHNQ